MSRSYWLFIFLMCGLCLLGQAQHEPLHSTLTLDDGLPSNEVYWVHQDRQGDLLIGTEYGLVKYDGITMRIITTRHGLADNTIFKIYEDWRGRIWLMTYKNGVCYLEGDSIIIPTFNKALTQQINKNYKTYIYSMYVDTQDIVYLSTHKATPGYFRTTLDGPPELIVVPQQAMGTRMEYLLKHNGKTILNGVANITNPTQLSPQACETVITADLEQLYTSTAEVNRQFLYQDDHGHDRWLATYKDLYEKIDNQWVWRAHYNCAILCIAFSQGHILIGTSQGVIHYKDAVDSAHLVGTYFKGQMVCHITRDRDGAFWMATAGNGLIRVPAWGWQQFLLPELLFKPRTAKTYYLHRDTLKILHENFLHTYRKDQRTFTHIHTQKVITPVFFKNPGWSNQGYLYTREKQIYHGPRYPNVLHASYNLKNKAQKSLLNGTRKILVEPHSKEERIYFQCMSGFGVLQNKRLIFNSRDIGFHEDVNALLEDSAGQYWIGTFHGLYSIMHKQITFWGDRYAFLNNRIEDLAIDAQGRLCIATRDAGIGLFHHDSLVIYDESKGLSSNFCRNIVAHHNTLWVGTNKGLNQLVAPLGTSYQIKQIGNENELGSGFISNLFLDDDQLVIQSGQHLTYLQLTDRISTKQPQVILSQIWVAGKMWHNVQDTLLNLANYQRTLQFHYRINSLLNSSAIKYRYRLSELQTEWTTSTQRTVTFTDLPVGDYTFELYACNAQGVWTTQPKRIHIHIKPALYQTSWFRLSSGSALTLLFLGGLLLFYRNKKRRKKQEDALLSANMHALEMQISPHFVFNALNSIQYFIATNQKREANVFLAQFSDLIRHTITKHGHDHVSLETEVKRLKDYISLEHMRLQGKFNWHISYSDHIVMQEIHLPPLMIQPLIENAIWHGLSHLESGGELTIDFQLQESVLIATIRDNGPGIDPVFLSPQPSEKSIGLNNIRNRLVLISQLEKKEYRMLIKHLKPQHPHLKGTEITLYFPQ